MRRPFELREDILASSRGDFSRKVWHFKSGAASDVGCIFLDGEFYLNKMRAVEELRALTQKAAIPSLACLFVSHVDGLARQQDYVCNPSYADFIAQDAVALLQRQNPELSSARFLLAGVSLSGLQAAYISLEHPELFPFVLCQSGSFWWNEEWLTKEVRASSRCNTRYWVSVGDKETTSGVTHPPTGLVQKVSQIAAAQRFVKAFGKRRDRVRHNVFPGGHDFEPWKEELPSALSWLLQSS